MNEEKTNNLLPKSVEQIIKLEQNISENSNAYISPSNISIEKIIGAYYNDPKLENLNKILYYDTECNFIMICWKVGFGFWYVASIYDNLIDDRVNDNSNNGWYIREEPTVNNIPVRHSRIITSKIIQTKNTKIICGFSGCLSPVSSEMKLSKISSSSYIFAINAYTEKLYMMDMLLRQKNKQEMMLSSISHSIRTPLNGILHITDNLLKNNDSIKSSDLLNNNTYRSDTTSNKSNDTTSNKSNDTTSNKYVASNISQLSYLNQSAMALATNIFDIIDMTKLELGKLKIEKIVFNVRDMIFSVMNIAHNLNKTKSINLDVYIEDSVPEYIYSDAKRIKQILINLLENSLQYCKSGDILLYVSSNIINLINEDKDRENSIIENTHELYNADMQYVINFSIRDTGPGMSNAIKEQIFYPVEFLKNSTHQGISLRISYMLANILGGNLHIVYSEPNKGTCIELNIIAPEEQQPTYLSNTIKSLKGKNVLLLDMTNDRINICKVLEKYGLSYIITSSYEEISVLHSGKKIDLVIIKSDNNIDLICNDIHRLFPNIKILYIGNILSKQYDFILDTNSDEQTIKIKLLEVFSYKQTSKNKNILIAEDEPVNRIVIEKILNQLGYTNITLAINGEETLKLFENNLQFYDVILIDIKMPGMSGFDVADKIHDLCEKYKIKDPKMIGVTAQMIIDENHKPWFNTFIYKPINIQDLEQKLI